MPVAAEATSALLKQTAQSVMDSCWLGILDAQCLCLFFWYVLQHFGDHSHQLAALMMVALLPCLQQRACNNTATVRLTVYS